MLASFRLLGKEKSSNPEVYRLAKGFGISAVKWSLPELLPSLLAFSKLQPSFQNGSWLDPDRLVKFLYLQPSLSSNRLACEAQVSEEDSKKLLATILRTRVNFLQQLRGRIRAKPDIFAVAGIDDKVIEDLVHPAQLRVLETAPAQRLEPMQFMGISGFSGFYYQGWSPFLVVRVPGPRVVRHRFYLNPSRSRFPEIVEELINFCAKNPETFLKFIDYTLRPDGTLPFPNLDRVRGDKIVIYCDNPQRVLKFLKDIYDKYEDAFEGRSTVPFTAKIECYRPLGRKVVMEGIGYGEEPRDLRSCTYTVSFSQKRAEFLTEVLLEIASKSAISLGSRAGGHLLDDITVRGYSLSAVLEQLHNGAVEGKQRDYLLGEVFTALATYNPELLIDLDPSELEQIARKHKINPANLSLNYPN